MSSATANINSFCLLCPTMIHRCQQYRFRASAHAFLAPSRFSAFHLKCPAFLAYFELEKMHSMRSFQRQVELRRLCNQFPVLGKANSLFKLVKCCVFCLFLKLRLSPHCIGPGIKIYRVIVARTKSIHRTDL